MMPGLRSLLSGSSAAALMAHTGNKSYVDPYAAFTPLVAGYAPVMNKGSGRSIGNVGFLRQTNRCKFGTKALNGYHANRGLGLFRDDFSFGNREFTYETWLSFPAVPTGTSSIMSFWDSNLNYGAIQFGYNATSKCFFVRVNNSANYLTQFKLTGPVFTEAYVFDGKFHHFALVRYAGKITIYIDGIPCSSPGYIGTIALTPTSVAYCINFAGGSGNGGRAANGIIADYDNIRFTFAARYTEAFDIPTAAFPTGSVDPYWADTVVLLDFEESYRFGVWNKEHSAVAGTFLSYGDTNYYMIDSGGLADDANYNKGYYSITAGSTDFNFGEGDFTIELWKASVWTASTSNCYIFTHWGYADGQRGWMFGNYGTAGAMRFAWSSDGITSTSASFGVTGEHDYAVCRQGNTLHGYVDGIRKFSVPITGPIFYNEAVPLGFMRAYNAAKSDSGISNNTNLKGVRITKGVARYTTDSYAVQQIWDHNYDDAPVVLPTSPLPITPIITKAYLLNVLGGDVSANSFRASRHIGYGVIGVELQTGFRANKQTLYGIVG